MFEQWDGGLQLPQFMLCKFVPNILVSLFACEFFVTSAKEVMFLPGFVCPSVSLFVSEITQKLMEGF